MNDKTYSVYIVQNDTLRESFGVAKGSALVAEGEPVDGFLTCFFEGNLYNAENLQTFSQKAVMAYYRLIENAPTIAKRKFAIKSLLKVGEIHSVIPFTPAEIEKLKQVKGMERFLKPAPTFIAAPETLPRLEAWNGTEKIAEAV